MKKKSVIFVCSDGGHLAQTLELKELFERYNYLLVTEDTPATHPLSNTYKVRFLKPRPDGKKRTFAFYRSILSNFIRSFKIILEHKPHVIITTGSHTAVPLCILGKLFGIKIVWILSFARINSKAASANLIYPIANEFIVQWPQMKSHYKKATYLGSIY
ncbi:PssD/Cps14F family polysaccharide biosynthesis glycosyltransferase [Pararhodonellum marinum]|uniref:PssD/Cps14F family polysaccharide biosynthesis glycosyltransferase n=1 Tax=Pararhodonellum marinum TaxID=2755358 RepID=UPI00188FD401